MTDSDEIVRDEQPAAEPSVADATQAQDTPKRPWWRSPRFWVVAGGVVLLLAITVPIVLTLQPGYYARYPLLSERIHNWSVSTHAKVACGDCHIDPGITGFVDYAVKAVPDFYSQLIFGPKKSNVLGVPSSEACHKCHTTYRQVSPSGDLLIPHRAHVTVLKIKCATCHKQLVHSKDSGGFNSPRMQTCMDCHDGKQATNECSKCHTGKQAPPSHKEPTWLEVHGSQAETSACSGCHGWTPNYCKDCHSQRPASHAGNYKQTHKDRIAKLGEKACFVCHDEKQFCGKCH